MNKLIHLRRLTLLYLQFKTNRNSKTVSYEVMNHLDFTAIKNL